MKKNTAKKFTIWISIIILVLVIFLSPLFAFIKSIFVMSIYSASESKTSLMKKEGIDLKIPGGYSTLKKDWYPFVITYNAHGFSNFTKKDVDLSILYNFGAFDYIKGSSLLYSVSSDYHSAFYGAYAVKENGNSYGYNQYGKINVDEMADIFKYDMQVLVLQSIGCDSPIFDFEIKNIGEKEVFLGFTWDVIDANIITNSPLHNVNDNHRAYIQYGKPSAFDTTVDYEKTKVYGRIYAQHIEEKNVTLCFYIIAPSLEALETCETDMIKNSKLSFK